MTAMELAPSDDLKAEAERFRKSGEMGRSEALNRLFQFLLDRSVAGNIPKEIEVAREVFGKDTQFDTMQDASVRVYVYRLRKKLDDYYLLRSAETRLLIPRGEYRLALEPTASVPLPADEDEADETQADALLRDASSVLLDCVPSDTLASRVQERLRGSGAEIADFHLWQVGPGHHAVIASLAAAEYPADHYRQLLTRFPTLSHVTIELIGGEPRL